MTVRVRFAPSPTGFLHVGNVQQALRNFLFARREGGTFILRIDDTDLQRSTAEYETAIEQDLAWLGLPFDQKFNQSARFDRYEAAMARLREAGLLYPAYETEDELDRTRKLRRAQGLPPVYNRAALELTAADHARFEAEGRRPHWRFRLSHRTVEWNDLVRGAQTIETASLSDPILVREDGSYLYTLPSVVDDIEFAITHVVRGEDHVTNSAAQIELFQALGAEPPQFAHAPLLVGSDGGKLSKRLGTLAVSELRDIEGIEPMAICDHLARLGTSDPIEPFLDFAPLIESFSFDRIGRAPARFDPAELRALNAKLLHATPYDAVAPRLAAMGVTEGEEFWNAIRGNLETLKQAADWRVVVEGPIEPVIEDRDFAAAALAVLPEGALTRESWGAWTAAVKSATGRKGKDLFLPLRLALTGKPKGPEMDVLLALIGRERAVKRLQGHPA